ncbi:MAG: twin transmembrane helix small protein [Betaproteobacteria bacterium]|nr:twin transmembrane helix small protein [Betaproteobacteria bacterium]
MLVTKERVIVAIKALIVVMLLAILASLFSGLFFLKQDRGDGTRAVRALTVRIGLSILLFVILLVAFRFGLLAGVPGAAG